MEPERSFDEPWQAQAFAMAVALNEQGLFSWSDWAAVFAPLNDGANYWDAWLAALERIVGEKTDAEGELSALFDAWRAAANATPHGEPITLRR